MLSLTATANSRMAEKKTLKKIRKHFHNKNNKKISLVMSLFHKIEFVVGFKKKKRNFSICSLQTSVPETETICNSWYLQIIWWREWGRRSVPWYSVGIIVKLKQNGISGYLLELLADFLKDRKRRVDLNGQVSS